MVDDDDLAITAIIAGKADPPGRGGDDLAAGAGGDALGSITVFGERVTAAMLQVDAAAALGAWAVPAQAPYLFEEGWSVFAV